MRGFVVLLGAGAISIVATGTLAAPKIRLAQTSLTTNCMMSCNAQAATCQTTCLVPSTQLPTGVPTFNSVAPLTNPMANTTCVLVCTNSQLACQTSCASQSPSR
jgi:hypothetical protein